MMVAIYRPFSINFYHNTNTNTFCLFIMAANKRCYIHVLAILSRLTFAKCAILLLIERIIYILHMYNIIIMLSL